MMNESSYEFASCPHDGAMWLEEVSYTPATRWQPEDADLISQPCPVCGNEDDTLYACNTRYGEFGVAVLECARVIAYAIECWGLPCCKVCGEQFYEGWSDGLCWRCGEREAEEYMKREGY